MGHTLTTNGNQAILTLTNKQYKHDAGIIRDEMIEKIETGHHHLTLNLAGVTYIDSSGLGVLVTLHKMTQEKNGSLTLIGVQGMVKELLQRTRLDKVLQLES